MCRPGLRSKVVQVLKSEMVAADQEPRPTAYLGSTSFLVFFVEAVVGRTGVVGVLELPCASAIREKASDQLRNRNRHVEQRLIPNPWNDQLKTDNK